VLCHVRHNDTQTREQFLKLTIGLGLGLVFVCFSVVSLKPNSITLAGSKLVRAEIWPIIYSELVPASRFAAKFHYAIWFEAGSKPVDDQLRIR